jgi:hypothetical protein
MKRNAIRVCATLFLIVVLAVSVSCQEKQSPFIKGTDELSRRMSRMLVYLQSNDLNGLKFSHTSDGFDAYVDPKEMEKLNRLSVEEKKKFTTYVVAVDSDGEVELVTLMLSTNVRQEGLEWLVKCEDILLKNGWKKLEFGNFFGVEPDVKGIGYFEKEARYVHLEFLSGVPAAMFMSDWFYMHTYN